MIIWKISAMLQDLPYQMTVCQHMSSESRVLQIVIVVMSLAFISFVTVLHIVGKVSWEDNSVSLWDRNAGMCSLPTRGDCAKSRANEICHALQIRGG